MPMRGFNETHIKEDLSDLSGSRENELLYGCRFKKLNGLTLKDCVLDASVFETDSIRDALGFTMTLNCFSFRGVTYSPLLFDLFLSLAAMSSGNDEKREKLLDVIGRDRAAAIMRVMKETE